MLKDLPSSPYLSASLPNEDVRSHSSSAILNSRSMVGPSHSFKISPIVASQQSHVFSWPITAKDGVRKITTVDVLCTGKSYTEFD